MWNGAAANKNLFKRNIHNCIQPVIHIIVVNNKRRSVVCATCSINQLNLPISIFQYNMEMKSNSFCLLKSNAMLYYHGLCSEIKPTHTEIKNLHLFQIP